MTQTSSLILPLQLLETFRVSTPTVFEALMGKDLPRDVADARLRGWAENAVRLARCQLIVEGLEHVDGGSHILMSNHQSAYDVFTLFVAYPRSMRMIAKKAMFALPIMGRSMKIAGFVEIDRSNHERALLALERAKEIMATGINIWIAPEGTRSDDGVLLPFKRGGFMMAQQMDCPILPVSIEGSREVLPAKDYRVRKGQTVKITFHPPVHPADFGTDGRDALMADVKKTIASALPYR
ncbi:MAG: lysophospholipid acyltransferase family protein [Sandaracinaceae bacterium]